LELCQANRRTALLTVVGLLEDGETYSTELKQRQRPGQGKMGQWEHELVIQRYVRDLMVHCIEALRFGFLFFVKGNLKTENVGPIQINVP
jgi:hypothetical protein